MKKSIVATIFGFSLLSLGLGIALKLFVGYDPKPTYKKYPEEIRQDFYNKIHDPESFIRRMLRNHPGCHLLDQHIIDNAYEGNLFDKEFSTEKREKLYECLDSAVNHPESYYRVAKAVKSGYWKDSNKYYAKDTNISLTNAAGCGHLLALQELATYEKYVASLYDTLSYQIYLHRNGHKDWLYLIYLLSKSPLLTIKSDFNQMEAEAASRLSSKECR